MSVFEGCLDPLIPLDDAAHRVFTRARVVDAEYDEAADRESEQRPRWTPPQ